MCLRVKLKIADKSITYAYSLAKSSVVDPVKDASLTQKMGYPEFLVCLCGIANEYFKDDPVLSQELTLDEKLHKVIIELSKQVL